MLTNNQKKLLLKNENFVYFTKLLNIRLAGGILSESPPDDFKKELNSLIILLYNIDCPYCGSVLNIENFTEKIPCYCGKSLKLENVDYELRYDLDDEFYEQILNFFEQDFDYEIFTFKIIIGENKKTFLEHTGMMYIHITLNNIWGNGFQSLDELYLDHYSIDWINFFSLFDFDKKNLLFNYILNYREFKITKRLHSSEEKDFMTNEVINILQLSDFHFKGNGGDVIKEELIHNLINDLKEFLSKKIKVDIVIISGDLTDSAQINQFEMVNEYIFKVLEEKDSGLEINRENLYIVPGNHDIDWSHFDQVLFEELTSKYSEEYQEKLFYDEKYEDKLKKHFNKLENFKWFQENFLKIEPLSYKKLYLCRIFTRGNFSIGLLGLNSAWSGGCKDEKGKLLFSLYQIYEAINELNKMGTCNINIAFFHHPLNNMNESEIEIIKPLLYNKFLLLMFGHQHSTGYEFIEKFTTPTHLIRAGPIYKTNEKIKGTYNLIQINPRKKIGRIIFRKPHKTNSENFHYDWEASPLKEDREKQGVFKFKFN